MMTKKAPIKMTRAADFQRESHDLYQKHRKIYPKATSGLYAQLRVVSVLVLLALYYGFPWLQWGGRQAVLFDLPNRQFHYFGITFWPHDFFYLSLLLIIAALTLFFFTALAGRLWCGYACPQTVWTKTFLWFEKWVEGESNQRIKLDQAPWTLNKIKKKTLKHSLWLIFAFFTGFTFVGYFTPIDELSMRLLSAELGGWETFWIMFYSLATYGNAGKLREQVCIYMCPYARFQSAMFDKDTLIISYDKSRGEKRGRRNRKANAKALGLGDCINCQACVQVCPTGIDIRDGLQIECIACAACVDACDAIMDKMDYPKGLVRYTTEHAEQGKQARILRPRMVLYASLLLALIGGFAMALWYRVPLELDIIRDRQALYVTNAQGEIENIYTLKVLNMDQKAHQYHLSIAGLSDLTIQGETNFTVRAGELLSVPIRLTVPSFALENMYTNLVFTLSAKDASRHQQIKASYFIGPEY